MSRAESSGVSHPTVRATSVRWRVLAILVFASFVPYVLRTNVSIAGEAMIADLGLSRLQLGVVMAAFAWGYALFQFPGGLLGDRVGPRRAVTGMAIAWTLLNLLMAFVPGGSLAPAWVALSTLVVLRFLMGAAQAPIFPVTGGGTICAWFPVSGWAFPTGLSNAGLTLGSAAAGPGIAWLTLTLGWRASFAVTAPLGLLVAGLWWWYVTDSPAEHPAIAAEEVALIDAGRPPALSHPEPGAWREVLRNRQVWLLTSSYFCSNYVFYFFFNWLFIYLVDDRGMEALEGGFYSAAPWMAGAVGAVVGGDVSDRLARRLGLRRGYRILPIAGLLMAGGLIYAAGAARGPVAAVVLLSLCLAFQQLTEGAFWAATIAVSGGHAAVASGVLNTGGNVVGGVVALSVPLVVDAFGWAAALGTASLVAFVAAALWIFIDAGSGEPREAQKLA
jgi:ACS family glucarate transporter-like MFS transporter